MDKQAENEQMNQSHKKIDYLRYVGYYSLFLFYVNFYTDKILLYTKEKQQNYLGPNNKTGWRSWQWGHRF